MKYFRSLTGLRAIAAYLVFCHHFNFFKEYSNFSTLSGMVDELYIGVGIFFVLSGFLIYSRYAESSRMTRAFWGTYIKNRFARIYPMYFIITSIAFGSLFYINTTNYSNGENVLIYILNITFLRGFFESFKYSGIVQGWTLTVEECFYMLAPIIFIFFKKPKNWLVILLGVYAAGILLTIYPGKLDIYGLFANFQFTFVFTVFGRLFEFFTGMYLARSMQGKSITPTPGFTLTLSGCVLITLMVYLLSIIKTTFNVQQGIFHPVGIAVNNLLVPIGVAILIKGLITEINWVTRLLSTRTFDLLGKSSYAFYLIHMGVVYNAVAYLFPFDPYFIPFIILNLLSIALYKLVEHPLNAYIRRSRKETQGLA